MAALPGFPLQALIELEVAPWGAQVSIRSALGGEQSLLRLPSSGQLMPASTKLPWASWKVSQVLPEGSRD